MIPRNVAGSLRSMGLWTVSMVHLCSSGVDQLIRADMPKIESLNS